MTDLDTNALLRIMEGTPLFHSRPLALAALGMLVGTLLAGFFAATAVYILSGALAALALTGALLERRSLAILLIFAAAALALAAFRATEPPLAGRHTLEGRICESPQRGEAGWIVTLDDVSVDRTPRRQRLRLFVREGAPSYGQRVEAEASLAEPDSAYRSNNDYLRISCVGYAQEVTVKDETQDAYGALLKLRARIAENIDALFPESGGVAAGMLLGEKSGIAEDTMNAYRESGAAHLLAVSGLHVSVLASAWTLLFRRRVWLRFIFVALFLAFYAALTAFSPSVLRAGVMLLCWQLSTPLRMPPDRVSALSLAFVVVLFINPYALYYVGFQLSFFAAYGLALLAPMLRERFKRLGRSLSGVLAGGVSVWLATLPAQAAFFQTVSPVSLVSNLFILPLVPFFLIPAFLVTLLSFLSWPAANALACLPRLALRAIDLFARLGTGFRLALPAPPPAALLLWLLGILLASRLCMRARGRRALYAGTCFLAAAALWLF